ncbi:uncharacterized protein P884DRAFT_323763, partial [Thermothelomyces heterothallicus CBS 202.75]|uniref:uncharacterized protein n=1 Tax=Thermothelomyces heterothallicus CBS 202.75 TaxID=1149848 RepID=UPI0037449B80
IAVVVAPPRHGQPSQLDLAERVRTFCEDRPLVILTCCDVRELGLLEMPFPTVIRARGLDPLDLEVAAGILFGELLQNGERRAGNREHRAIFAAFQSAVLDLWCQCLPEMLHLSRDQFGTLLCRDGYAMHYDVREPKTAQVLGFCATYTTCVDGGECLLRSLAALLVQPSHRRRGIGRSYMTTLCVNSQRHVASPVYNLGAPSLGSSMGCLLTRSRSPGFNGGVGRSSLLQLQAQAKKPAIGFSNSKTGRTLASPPSLVSRSGLAR